MLDSVRARLVGWQSRFLSIGGRALILIKVVLSYIHIYQMSVHVLSGGVKRKLCGFFSPFI